MTTLHLCRRRACGQAAFACALMLMFATGSSTSFAQIGSSTNERRTIALTFDN